MSQDDTIKEVKCAYCGKTGGVRALGKPYKSHMEDGEPCVYQSYEHLGCLKRNGIREPPAWTYRIDCGEPLFLEGGEMSLLGKGRRTVKPADLTTRRDELAEEYEYEYLGDFSATPPWHSRNMSCDKCKVRWIGCWDNFQCPKCGEGELPAYHAMPEEDEE